MKMDKMLKECTKPHPLLHLVSGAGLGLLLVGLMPGLAMNAMMLGLVLVVVGVAGEFLFMK